MSTADELKSLGNKAFAAGNHDEAIKLFTQAIDVDPANHVLYSNRSASLASLKKYEEALKDAEKTIEIKPDWPKGYSRKGAALFGLQRFGEAHETYEAGLKIDPSNALLQKGIQDAENALNQQADSMGFGDFATKMSEAFKGDVLAKIAANPKTAPFLAQPDYVEKVKAIQANPNKLQAYADDQRITVTLFSLMGMGDIFAQAAGRSEGAAPSSSSAQPSAPTPGPKADKGAVVEEEDRAVAEEAEQTEEEKEAAANKEQATEAKALGNAAYKARKFEAALEHYNKAIELDPSDITFLNNKAA
ncbi:Hsp90 cochaperone, partial [Dipsacomyces acuminosporus]